MSGRLRNLRWRAAYWLARLRGLAAMLRLRPRTGPRSGHPESVMIGAVAALLTPVNAGCARTADCQSRPR